MSTVAELFTIVSYAVQKNRPVLIVSKSDEAKHRLAFKTHREQTCMWDFKLSPTLTEDVILYLADEKCLIVFKEIQLADYASLDIIRPFLDRPKARIIMTATPSEHYETRDSHFAAFVDRCVLVTF